MSCPFCGNFGDVVEVEPQKYKCLICKKHFDNFKKVSEISPLGLRPKWVWRRERFIEICEALSRYYNAGEKIPIKWIEEYNELVEEFCEYDSTITIL